MGESVGKGFLIPPFGAKWVPGGLGGMAVPVWASKIPHAPMTFQQRGAGERLAVIRGQCILGQAAPRVFPAQAFA